MQEDRIKHLEFIQAVVARLASNSFLLKGWTVTLAAALFALAANDANPVFALVALFPALAFWGLDAYYLRQERLFRKLYDDIRNPSSSSTIEPFAMSTLKYQDQVESWSQTLRSPTIVGVHGVVVAVIFIVTSLLWLWK